MKKVTSRAELKIIQLELWLEPARLGLITSVRSPWLREKSRPNYVLRSLVKLHFVKGTLTPFLKITRGDIKIG